MAGVSSWNPRDTYTLFRDWGFTDAPNGPGKSLGDHWPMIWPPTGEKVQVVAPERPSDSPVNAVIFTKGAKVIGIPTKVFKAGPKVKDPVAMIDKMCQVQAQADEQQTTEGVKVEYPANVADCDMGWLVIAAAKKWTRNSGGDAKKFLANWFDSLHLDASTFGMDSLNIAQHERDTDPDYQFATWMFKTFPEPGDANPPRFKVRQVQQELGWTQAFTRRYLTGACKQGWMTNHNGTYTLHRKWADDVLAKTQRHNDKINAEFAAEWDAMWQVEEEVDESSLAVEPRHDGRQLHGRKEVKRPDPAPSQADSQEAEQASAGAVTATVTMNVIGKLRNGAVLATLNGKHFECYEIQSP